MGGKGDCSAIGPTGPRDSISVPNTAYTLFWKLVSVHA